MFWWKYKEKRKVSKIDDDSKPEEVGGGGGGGWEVGTLLYSPFTYEWYQMVWLLNPFGLKFYSLIPSDLTLEWN